MQDRARERPNIEFKTPFVPEEFVAGDGGALEQVRLRNAETGEVEEVEVGGAFVAIGHIPGSELVKGQVDLHDNGYVKVEEPSTRTNLAGVFAVGDLVDFTYRQAVTAAGSGCRGALDAEWYLRDTPPTDGGARSGRGERDRAAERPASYRPARRISVKTARPSSRSSFSSSATTCETALISARWVNACGKLPSWRPETGSISSA